MKLRKLYENREAIEALGKVKLTPQRGWEISMALIEAKQALDFFDEQRDDLLKELGTDEGGGRFKINHPEQFETDMDRIADVELDVEWPELRIEDFGDQEIEISTLVGLRNLKIITDGNKKETRKKESPSKKED